MGYYINTTQPWVSAHATVFRNDRRRVEKRDDLNVREFLFDSNQGTPVKTLDCGPLVEVPSFENRHNVTNIDTNVERFVLSDGV